MVVDLGGHGCGLPVLVDEGVPEVCAGAAQGETRTHQIATEMKNRYLLVHIPALAYWRILDQETDKLVKGEWFDGFDYEEGKAARTVILMNEQNEEK